jgi:ProP effector
MSLRHYTSGWKYLASVKEGNQRVDLLGELGDKVEAEHAQHAQEQLKESKAKAAQKRQEQKPERKPDRKPDASKPSRAKTSEGAKAKKAHIPKRKVNTPTVPKMQVAPLTESALKVGLKVSVKVGREPMPATVTDIGKDGVFVQLNSGMTVKVQQHQLRVIV